ncbi:AAA domain-containing protein [Citrus sinensis]|nr:AAA domain-containing protein [Citrus sinensis]
MGKAYAIGLISSALAAASASACSQPNTAFADGPLNFSPFSFGTSSQSGQAQPSDLPQPPAAAAGDKSASAPAPARVRNDQPRTTSAGFDPEPLERGAKLLREISASPNAKKAENEYHRARNQELVKMQEESSIRLEQARRATEEQIQAQKRQTEREKAEIERETIRVRAMAEAEGRAHEAKLAEDVNRRMLVDRANAEREKWIAAINTTFDHIGEVILVSFISWSQSKLNVANDLFGIYPSYGGRLGHRLFCMVTSNKYVGGLRAILTDQNKLVVAVGGATALAAGIYTTREGAKVIWGYVDRILGQPSLIRESSRGKYPWSGLFSRTLKSLRGGDKELASKNGNGFGDVILHPSLQKRIRQLSGATANTKAHNAPFRNMLFYGPPGTGKTMAARELARKSGLDYALMTGGDVAPLGPQAVTKIHQLFDWAKKSKRGLLLFIDEADAFLCERNKTYMSEAQRSALNALLFRTGDQSKDIVLALATNRPGDLDSAVADRIDEVLEFPLPGQEERFKLLKLYLDKYIAQAGSRKPGLVHRLFKSEQQKIEIKGLTDDILMEAAAKTEGFSGREIAKLMASVQAAVYGSENCVLDPSLFREVVDYKVAEHQQRRKLAAAGGGSN